MNKLTLRLIGSIGFGALSLAASYLENYVLMWLFGVICFLLLIVSD